MIVVPEKSVMEDAPREIFRAIGLQIPLDCVEIAEPARVRLIQDKLSLGHIAKSFGLSGRHSVMVAGSESRGWEIAIGFGIRSKQRIPFVVFHGQNWWSKRSKALAFVAKYLTNVELICLSESVRAKAISAYGYNPDRVHNASWAADTKFFKPSATSGTHVLSAGTASRDYRTLVNAARGASFRVRIAADSAWFREALNIDPSDVPANVSVFSAGNYAALRDEYAGACCVVVPLKNVDFACGYAVIAEAMAMGKPVICTATQCPTDLIQHGVNGLFVSPDDPVAVKQAIEDLLQNPAKAKALGQAARERAEAHGNIEAFARRVKAILDHATERRL